MRILIARHVGITSLSYTPDGGTLFGSGWRGAGPDRDGLNVWNLGGASARADIRHAGILVWRCWPLPDARDIGLALTLPDGTIQRLPVPVGVGWHVAVSPAGDRVVVAEWTTDRAVVGYRISPDRENRLWHRPYASETVRCFAVEYDATRERFLSTEFDWRATTATARWRSAADGSPQGDPISLTRSTTDTRLLPDGSRLIAIARGTLFSYDLAHPEAKPAKATSGNRRHFTGMAVHPNSRRVLATCNDASVREYDAATLAPIRAYDWKVGKLHCVTIAPDGLTAAAVGGRRKVVVWDLE